MVILCSHPLILDKMTRLRAVETKPPEFRRLVRSLTQLIVHEATADLRLTDKTVETPLGVAFGKVVAETIAIVPILRAGLGMVDALLDLVPEAQVWHIGIKRNEDTLAPEEYYQRVPKYVDQVSDLDLIDQVTVLIVDPMLATGGSAIHACKMIRSQHQGRIKYLSLIGAPEGIDRLSTAMPDIQIYVGCIDERLNDVGYIYPGLGDAGDRQFATFSE